MRKLLANDRSHALGRSHEQTTGRYVGLLARLLTGLIAVALVVGGCSSRASGNVTAPGNVTSPNRASASVAPTKSSAPTEEASDQLTGILTIFAAASLKATFDELRRMYQAQHPNVDFPEITYDGSSTLVTQLRDGAPADVFASADQKNMDKVNDLITGRVDFATNTLRIAVAPGNPKHISSLADIAAPGILTVICAPEVPCGAASHKALDAAGVDLTPVSEEQNVTAVLTKVETGDADAGLVYATDINSAGDAALGVDFPESAQAVNVYPIGALKDSKNAAAAQAFIDLVTNAEGQKVLAGVGFGKP